jgi:hypothetical protein
MISCKYKGGKTVSEGDKRTLAAYRVYDISTIAKNT